MRRKAVFFASVDTGHWVFTSVGETRSKAISGVMAAWKSHKSATGATMDNSEVRESIDVLEMEFGVGYRDGMLCAS